MGKGVLRVGVVGSSSLVGKELAEELAGSSALGVVDVVLLDEDVEVGKITAAGDEPAFVQRIEAGSFEGMDLCFFAGTAEETRRHWAAAIAGGAGVVDLTNALPGQDRVEVWMPWVGGRGLRAGTRAVIPAHPVAGMLALIAVRCRGLGLTEVAATVLEPASERGAAGVDEMHKQTVSLLSFQSVPQVEFDTQVAFNLVAELGGAARVSMEATTRRILADARAAVGETPGLMVQMVHAPVFHGYGLSVLLEFARDVTVGAVEAALTGEYVEIAGAGEPGPSNVSAAGQGLMLARVAGEGRRVWVWVAADNLKVAALQAIACGAGMLGVSGQGARVQ